MDDKGYSFTPLALLLIIPVVILATSYGDIANEINSISQVVIGGDVTYDAAITVIDNLKKSTADAGRYAAYNATRTVIDNEAKRWKNPFFANSTSYIRDRIVSALNNETLNQCKNLESETGRQIYIDNKRVTEFTGGVFTPNDIIIYQTEPYGFYVNTTKKIPVTVIQNGQNFTGYAPTISVYVSIEGLEDPYMWVNTLDRRSYVIYRYPGYDDYLGKYHFDDRVNGSKLYGLWDCLNGTNNKNGIDLRPYYFPDGNGLTFFDRLENRKISSNSNNKTRMSTFIIGDPLHEEHSDLYGTTIVSCVDHEYFDAVAGTKTLTVNGNIFKDPLGNTFYLSPNYFSYFKFKTSGIYP